METRVESILTLVGHSPAVSEKIARVIQGERGVVFDHVAEQAQPFMAAVLANSACRVGRRVWVLCENEKAQEKTFSEMNCWLSNALLFPHLEMAVVEDALPDPEISAERLNVLEQLADDEKAVAVVLNQRSLQDLVPAASNLHRASIELPRGQRVDRDKLLAELQGAGYEAVPQTSERGQYSVRGGVIDIYSWQQILPVRLEWFDEELESIREFDLDDQTSVRNLDHCSVLLRVPTSRQTTLRSYLREQDVVVSVGSTDPEAAALIVAGAEENIESAVEQYAGAFYTSPLDWRGDDLSPAMADLADARTIKQLRSWNEDGSHVYIQYFKNSELTAIKELIGGAVSGGDRIHFLNARGLASFVFPDAKLVVLSASELLGVSQTAKRQRALVSGSRKGLSKQRTQVDFTSLKEGELVVHLEHGLSRFLGLERRAVRSALGDGEPAYEEVMALEFAGGAKLFVPLEQAFLVSRYVGMGKRHVTLSQLGDGKWSATKKAAEKSIYDYAAQLIKVQAVRELHPGFAYGPDGAWQREFEGAFPYKETSDQLKAIHDTKLDMEQGRPMDRLVCGDVGFGKTEVAIRAAFKAATSGKQVAMMVPTTVLAQQHYENFRDRMARYPVTVELLSRYRSNAEQSKVAQGLQDGSVDIVVGTHRLISKDVQFKDLGLLIVDEEQRFGVRHKERIKERFPNVDVITLSATPIPRTLYMALTGARDLSTIETPPPNRYPVDTVICAYDERVIRTAIDRELERDGQVYFLHNRVEDIQRVAARIKHLCPRAKVDLGHGQMEEGELEGVMHRFVSGKTNVLVATTIIESGLDIPNANTIIIDRADRFGLADLYQLRGRVGRGNHKAYAYLMLPRELLTVGEARKRINAIKQYSALGAGFKIALRDLEIRGAGNILGLAQSGHLTAIGFDLYCQLLRQAVGKLKGEKAKPRAEAILRLDFVATSEAEYLRRQAAAPDHENGEAAAGASMDGASWPAFLPTDYVQDASLRIQAYRQLAGTVSDEELKKLRDTWCDRFGRMPLAAENLVTYTRLRLLASRRKMQSVEVKNGKVMVTRHGDLVLTSGKFPRLTSDAPVTKMRELFTLLETL